MNWWISWGRDENENTLWDYTTFIKKPLLNEGKSLSFLWVFFYSLCNGGLPNNSGSNGNGQLSVVGNFSQPVSKGLNFREVLAYLVLITRGTREEKIKCKNHHALVILICYYWAVHRIRQFLLQLSVTMMSWVQVWLDLRLFTDKVLLDT